MYLMLNFAMEDSKYFTHEEWSDGKYGSGRRDSRSIFLQSVNVEIPTAIFFHAFEGPEFEVIRVRGLWLYVSP